jgi:hypothetical protein
MNTEKNPHAASAEGYREKAAESADAARTAESSEAAKSAGKSEKAYAAMAENEEWLAKNGGKTVHKSGAR